MKIRSGFDSAQIKADRTGYRCKELIRDVSYFNLELMAFVDTAMAVRTMVYGMRFLTGTVFIEANLYE